MEFKNCGCCCWIENGVDIARPLYTFPHISSDNVNLRSIESMLVIRKEENGVLRGRSLEGKTLWFIQSHIVGLTQGYP